MATIENHNGVFTDDLNVKAPYTYGGCVVDAELLNAILYREVFKTPEGRYGSTGSKRVHVYGTPESIFFEYAGYSMPEEALNNLW